MNESDPRLKEGTAECASLRFSLARNMKLDDEMILAYEEFPAAIYFRDALDVARAYVRKGDATAAWGVLRDRIPQSVYGLPEQVAPIVLLIDDELRPLMTPERCALVLSTPRGWEAAQK